MDKEKNEVMEGYKETEIGVLPADWEVVRLGEVARRMKAGGTPSTSEPLFWSGGIPFVKVEDVARPGKYLIDTISSITEHGLKNSNAWLVPENSILLSMYGTAGEVKISRKEMAISQNVLGIVPNENIFIEFMYYILNWAKNNTLSLITDVTIFKHFTLAKAKQIIFPLPPLSEQRKIAYVLSTIQKAIELQDKVIAALRELKKSLMRHLFTYGPVPVDQIDRVPLKETEIGMVPEHWEVVRLGEVTLEEKGAIKIGPFGSQLKKTELTLQGKKVYGQENVIKNNFLLGNRFIDDVKFQALLSFKVNPGDVLLTAMGTIGYAAVFPENAEEGIIDSHLIRIKVNKDKMSPYFLKLCFSNHKLKEQLNMYGHGVIMKGLNTSIVKSFSIPLPPLPEQHLITHILTIVDNKINIEQNRKSALQSLFQTMLHLLMTGRVRVKDLEVKEDALRR
ncbi:restriction endonuclease subunit S [Moorella sp. E306M]|uniref:restriction endonuclease subunit S n=1 Tax=Moorella sp. E306M TaxID=2572683 RepID=UPI0010FFBB5E|nr:restriction endonuclease subunit S [Moorella sp. E306M]GEA18929.1 restriction endonuclease subunit S [Moorella sp. E306M]